MKIAILTSSRADYGIYKPLIKAFNEDPYFDLTIIAFGTHLSVYHGHTIDEIINDGITVDYKINSLLLTDDENSISSAIGLTTIKFAEFWDKHSMDFDVVFCLGDRYEMFAAVMAGVSFGVKFAHIHGGETTLGAIDNVFRHSITLAAKIHFVATTAFAERIRSIVGEDDQCNDILTVGALSLDNLKNIKLLSNEEFLNKWQIDLNIPSVLITIHPETIMPEQYFLHLNEILGVIDELKNDYQLIITMPNADTNGSIYRNAFKIAGEKHSDKIKLIENFGTQSYFTCMREASFLMGNTSSGIIEAASFNKYVINVGDRQKGRLSGKNVINIPFSKTEILKSIIGVEALKHEEFTNIYYIGGATEKIIKKLKEIA
jgi:GDP/UDP-N,N'-diacetylbacillosamine 2-epimerase (hydrolysing)